MSLCAGLSAMNEYKNKSGESLSIDITSNDPDDYFIEIELKDSNPAFILPSHIKALSPSLKIECKWRLNSIVSWCLFRVRYYVISGTGKIVLSSKGGFANKKISSEVLHRRKPSSLIFADSKLKWDVVRTELWYPYIIGKTELFDLNIKGNGNYLIKNILCKDMVIDLTSPESVLNVIGKFFGF